ncbi:TPA: ABC transporter permease subunit [Mannheimia haemolytica]|uniref:ABC transporter permease subunit n=1 Tax=Mannheimia haemolytica TaxID=75985 RepID=A0A547EPZ2_MANHA|nr:ABC transporter permease subunit [Mannheimia haemolytica]AWW71422.1 antimicrobial peptide ABC transporter permease SapC [Pasteurellaceae bacterium 12565]AGI32587.1 antimicrobial peptide ABC transporter permease SapC [Mannheimia haemolytica USDA-ARS-USMARC-183]AGI35470.1 antimicrobial peptide ABC transporter permease SapC [Mannheimia haemolytica USDA-ARS-USMARC-185]AGK02294.1 peptide ABC transport system SapABCDF - membrane protein SapC [Mannheimia haemolytica M42548]AGQ24861.1 peptide ABC t
MAVIKEPEQFRETNAFKAFWFHFRQDKLALGSFYLFLLLLALIFVGSLLAPYNYNEQFVGLELMPPSWDDKGQISHFLGTDDLGRDILSRIMYGFYYTLGSALMITLLIAIIGGMIGIYAGLKKGRSFWLISHLFDTFLFMPILLIAIIIATLMEASLVNAMLAIFLAMLPHFIHKIYQATEKQLKKEYIITLKLDGASCWYLIREVIIPNLTGVAIKALSHIFVIAILDISALSFIMLGAKSPTPEWGAMIRESMELIYIAPWTVILPGLAIIFSIFTVTILGTRLSVIFEKYRKE